MRKKSVGTVEREKLARFTADLADDDDSGALPTSNISENWRTLILGCGSNAFSQLNFSIAHLNSLHLHPVPINTSSSTTPSNLLKNHDWQPQQLSSSGNMSTSVLVTESANVTKGGSGDTPKQHQALYTWGTASSVSACSIFKTPLFLPIKGYTVAQISCGHGHIGFVTTDGKVYTFGAGDDGVLGHGTKSNVPAPKLVEKMKHLFASSISCGAFHTAVIASESSAMQFINIPPPDPASYSSNIYQNSGIDLLDVLFDQSLSNHKFFVSGQLFVFGQGKAGQLGLDSFPKPNNKMVPSPTLVSYFPDHSLQVVKVSCGFHHTAVIAVPMQAGRVFSTSLFTFGFGEYGRLGQGSEVTISTPKQVDFPAPFRPIDVSCGEQHSVCCGKDGSVYAWGSNDFGQLGLSLSSTEPGFSPQRVPLPEGLAICQVAAGGRHSACLARCGRMVTFGWGEEGQLGQGSEKDSSLPRPCHLPRIGGEIGQAVPVKIMLGMSHSAVLVYNTRYRPSTPSPPVISPQVSPPAATPSPEEAKRPAVVEVVEELPKPPPSPYVPPKVEQEEDEVEQEEDEEKQEEEQENEEIVTIRGIKDLLQHREELTVETKEEETEQIEEEKEEPPPPITPSPPVEDTPLPFPLPLVPDTLPISTELPADVEEEAEREEDKEEREGIEGADSNKLPPKPAPSKVQVYYKSGQNFDHCLVANSAKRAEARKMKKSQNNNSHNSHSNNNTSISNSLTKKHS